MSQLEELYTTIETLRKHGLAIDHKLQEELDHCEEELIRQEVLPLLRGGVAERLNRIRRDVVLVVEYHPGAPITVELSRRARRCDGNDAAYLPPTCQSESTPEESPGPHGAAKEASLCATKPQKNLRVTFPDGTVIWNPISINTYLETLRRIGFERVASLELGRDIVSRERLLISPNSRQRKCDGWFIYVNLSRAKMMHLLKTISKMCHLELRIELA